MIVLITYQLTSGKDYSGLTTEIKDIGDWWHYMDNTWLIKTTMTPNVINDRIRPFINQGKDTILITRIDATNYTGWLVDAAHDWIKKNR